MNLSGREWMVFGLVVLAVLLIGLLVVGFFGSFGSGMMGYSMMGPGHMGSFGFGGGLLACFIPLILVGLLVGGLIWLVTAGINPSSTDSVTADHRHCPTCHRTVQPDWQVCPYCGTSLRQEEEQ